MDSLVKIYLQRAANEITVAKLLLEVSDFDEKKEEFGLEKEMTFYSSVITHSYYCIFYSAKAILLTKGVKTEMPNIHKRTYEAFKEFFVDTGKLDLELLNIYKKMIIRADELLEIFKEEKWKRGNFTYNTIPQANKEPADQSAQNATLFLKNIKIILEK